MSAPQPERAERLTTIHDIYRARLRQLIAEFGTQAAFADAIDKAPAQVSQWLLLSGAGARQLSPTTAREIEAMLGKPHGWMDQPMDVAAPQGATLPAKLAAPYALVDLRLMNEASIAAERLRAMFLKRKAKTPESAALWEGQRALRAVARRRAEQVKKDGLLLFAAPDGKVMQLAMKGVPA